MSFQWKHNTSILPLVEDNLESLPIYIRVCNKQIQTPKNTYEMPLLYCFNVFRSTLLVTQSETSNGHSTAFISPCGGSSSCQFGWSCSENLGQKRFTGPNPSNVRCVGYEDLETQTHWGFKKCHNRHFHYRIVAEAVFWSSWAPPPTLGRK